MGGGIVWSKPWREISFTAGQPREKALAAALVSSSADGSARWVALATPECHQPLGV